MSKIKSIVLIVAACSILVASLKDVRANPFNEILVVAASTQDGGGETAKGNEQSGNKDKTGRKDAGEKKEKTPEEKMQARFPQPAKVGHLIGLPVLDDNDSTIGYVQQVVRTPDGKIQLIVPYSKRFGWAQRGPLAWVKRLVAVPIESVAILGLQINAVDMDRSAFDRASTFDTEQTKVIDPDETIKIALGRR